MSVVRDAPEGDEASRRGPVSVARSEAELLHLARELLGPEDTYIPRLRQRPKRNVRIRAIGPTAMGLLQQTLARGVAAQLIRRGGWETRRTLVDGQPKRGSLWQRHAELPQLHFTRASFELLVWLRAEDVAEPKVALGFTPPTTLADELLHYFAAARIIHNGGDLRQGAFLRSPLCQLAYPDALAGADELPRLDFRRLCTGDGAKILEALQTDLAHRCVHVEQHKGEISSLDAMIQLGAAQDQAFQSLFRAVDLVAPRRRDLAGFVAEAGRQLLARGPDRFCPDPRFWTRGLDLRAPLSTRQAAFTAAAALLRAVLQLGSWLDEAGLVAHFDDDYEAAQLLLSSWGDLRRGPSTSSPAGAGPRPSPTTDDLPDAVLDRARVLANRLESLHSLGVTGQEPSP